MDRCSSGPLQQRKCLSWQRDRSSTGWIWRWNSQGNRPWQPRLESPDVPNILMADSFVIADDEVFLLLLSPIFGRHFETISYCPIASRTWCIKKHAENQLWLATKIRSIRRQWCNSLVRCSRESCPHSLAANVDAGWFLVKRGSSIFACWLRCR